MNLVSYKFVACQVLKKGVLIISEHSFLVHGNFWEKRYNHKYMHVTTHTSQEWGKTFVSELNDTVMEAELRTTQIPPLLQTERAIDRYHSSNNRLRILGFNATVTEQLSDDPKTTVVIVSESHRCVLVEDIEFGRLQVKDMLQHLWTGPISNASVKFVQGGRLVEDRANGVTKSVGVSGLLGQIIHEKDMTSPIDYVVCVGHSLPKVQLQQGSSSKKFLVSNFNNYKMVDSRLVMEQYNELLRILRQYTQHGLKVDESISILSIIDKLPSSWKDFKHTLKDGKDDLSLVQLGSHLRIEESLRAGPMRTTVVLVPTRDLSWNVRNVARLVTLKRIVVVVDAIAWWIDSSATTHVYKDRCWLEIFKPMEDGSVLYMGDEHFASVHGKGSVLYVHKLRKNLVSGPMLNKCRYKQVYESDKYISSKSGVFVGFGYYNNGMFMLNLNKVPDDSDSVYMSSSTVVNSSLWHARLGHVYYRRMLEMSKDDLIHAIDENPEKYTTFMLTKITRQPFKSITRKSVIRELIHRDLCDFHATPSLGNKKAVVRLPDPKRKTLDEKGIDCIFVGYAEHSKAYRPKDIIPNVQESQMDDHTDDVPNEIHEPRKGKRVRKAKSYGSDFQLYLVEGSRDQVGSQYSYCYSIKEDPRTYNEAMQSRVTAFWKEAIDDEIGSIMENNTWVLSDLPPGCKPLGCKWIFKRKMKVDGTIDKFKARLVIQGFRQKEGIDYFDTYAPVARIATIRLLLALAAIHNLVIHQMDVDTLISPSFL
nr:zinc finger, CCHC-type [Tanacetum cinerariifolium]